MVSPGDAAGADRHWFEDVADHLGPAYLRYSFTMGTAQEVGFLTEVLGLEPGMRVLDVGCGPGRHAVALARAGVQVVAVDISERFLEVGEDVALREGVSDLIEWHRMDARTMADDARVAGRDLDAAVSLCQGAFGLGGPPDGDDPQNLAPDAAVLAGIRAGLRPGGDAVVAEHHRLDRRGVGQAGEHDIAGAGALGGRAGDRRAGLGQGRQFIAGGQQAARHRPARLPHARDT